MEQTAVEWLYNKFSTCTSDEMVGNINNWFEQAKQMEREQSKRDYYAGLEGYIVKDGGFEQYYNETYGK